MRHKQIIFRDHTDTMNIHAQLWLPDREPLCLLQLVHGINDHGNRYGNFAGFLVENGIGVAVHDHAGHGKTAAENGNFGSFAAKSGWRYALADLQRFNRGLRQKFSDIPLVVLGHSMGSFMLRNVLIEKQIFCDAAILAGTASANVFVYQLASLACQLLRWQKGGECKTHKLYDKFLLLCSRGFSEKSKVSFLTRDENVWQEYFADPYCDFVPSLDMIIQMLEGMKHMDLRANYSKMEKELPLLIVSGKDDPIGNKGKGLDLLYSRLTGAGMKDVSLILYENCRHEILNELNKEQVYADILQWITDKKLR